MQDQSPGTPCTRHHCRQRRTWSLQTVLLFLQRLVGCVAGCHWHWLKESRLLALSRWRQAVVRATAWPKAVPEPSYEQDSCWKLEFILGAEYCQGLRADFSPRLHTCFTARAASLKESIPDVLISPPTVSSGDKKHLKTNQNSNQLAICQSIMHNKAIPLMVVGSRLIKPHTYKKLP